MQTLLRAPYFVVGEPVGPFAMNEYAVICPQTGDAALIDAGGDPRPFLETITRLGGTVRKILQTHAHIDHVAGMADTIAAVDVPIHLHAADQPLYDNAAAQGAMFGLRCPPLPPVSARVREGDVVDVGDLSFEVLHTPGHCPGHVCYLDRAHGILFAGDVLFRGSIGRTDLPGASPPDMAASLRRLLELDDEVRVFPGHMGPTTIGAERASNPFLQSL